MKHSIKQLTPAMNKEQTHNFSKEEKRKIAWETTKLIECIARIIPRIKDEINFTLIAIRIDFKERYGVNHRHFLTLEQFEDYKEYLSTRITNNDFDSLESKSGSLLKLYLGFESTSKQLRQLYDFASLTTNQFEYLRSSGKSAVLSFLNVNSQVGLISTEKQREIIEVIECKLSTKGARINNSIKSLLRDF